MKNLYKLFEKILVVKNTDEILKDQKNLIDYKIYEADDYIWIDISGINLESINIKSVFEKFYVLENHNGYNKSIVYDAISKHFDDIIDIEKNIDFNKSLCNILLEEDNINEIIDFGCGTGISYKYCSKKDINVLGVDKSVNMLNEAKKNGFLNTCHIDELNDKKYHNFFDGAIVSYVLHIIEDPQELNILCNSIKPGCRIIANFFKGQNIELYNKYFESKKWSINLVNRKNKYDHGAIYEYRKPYETIFINVDDALENCSKFENKHNVNAKVLLEFLIDKDIITYFKLEEDSKEKFILIKDFNIYINTINQYNLAKSSKDEKCLNTDDLFVFPISFDTFILTNDKNLDFKFFRYDINSIIKNLFYDISLVDDLEESYNNIITFKKENLEYKFVSRSKKKLNYLKEQIDYLENHFEDNLENLVVSPNYLGKKKKVSTFILNTIRQYSNKDSIMFDLMTGSGSVAGEMAKYWTTFSSDLQSYANIFSYSQGRGFSKEKADKLINEYFQQEIGKNLESLLQKTKKYVDKEYELINSKISEKILEEYLKFIKETPFYRTDINNTFNDDWNPYYEVEKRKSDNKEFPYCLFSCYFANCYFGFYQSLEIDSIRYAIDNIQDESIKKFALAALLTTVSYSAQGYGGHLAQPLYENEKNITIKNLSNLFKKRSKVITSDFYDRLISLGKQSELISNLISNIKGPWINALKELSQLHKDNVVVYVDPPYTYDEYGRYYHVFETLTLYNYPDSINRGRTPDKKKQERYSTNFTSKSKKVAENEIISIIERIINLNWTCVLSYASSGLASMLNVLNEVNKSYDGKINIHAYSTKHNHTRQGKNQIKKPNEKKNVVIEYLIVIKRK